MAPQITSPSNERIKRLVRLRDRRHRDAERVFVVEGDRLYQRALAAGLAATEIYVTERHPLATDSAATVVSQEAMDKASYRNHSEGLIAVFPQSSADVAGLALSDPPFLLIVESIEKPGNLGAMARTAVAAGADALIAFGGGVDPYNPNALRASTGAVFDIPIVECSPDGLLGFLEERSIRLVASAPAADRPFWDCDLRGPLALAVGAEDAGLSQNLIGAAAESVSIPMEGSVDSLNASVSLAVLAYEVVRQRN